MILRLLLLAGLLYGGLPYYSLYRLNHALVVDDQGDLERYVDLQQVRSQYKASLHIEQRGEEGVLSSMFRGTANSMSALSVDQLVTRQSIRQQLSQAGPGEIGESMFGRIDHAFFEGVDSFLVRLGPLGSDPLQLILRRDGLVWRLSAMYD